MNSIFTFFEEPNWLATLIIYCVVVYVLFSTVKILFSKYSWYQSYLGILKYGVYCVLIFEFGLRMIGINQTYFEKKSGKYESLYKYRPNKVMHKRTPNDSLYLESKGEFKFLFKTNSWGYSDREWIDTNDQNFKVLALGDSFTEGFGARQDSSWVAQISKMYFEKNIKWYNGGISASDPFTNLYNLQHELYQLKPDLVVQIFSNQDFEEDLLLRGGFERFKNNQLVYPQVPFFENIYAYSYIVRLFQNYLTSKNYYISTNSLKLNSTSNYYNQLLQLYNDWAQKNQTQVVLVFYFTASQYYNNGNKIEIDQSPKRISPFLSIESVTPCYQETFHKDPNAFTSYWWKKDGHQTAKGYHLMANCIHDLIQPIVDSTYISKYHE